MMNLSDAQRLHQQGRWSEAAAAYAMLAGKGEARAWFMLAVMHMQRHQTADALPALERYLDVVPKDVQALALQGMALQILGQHEQAILSLQSALTEKPEDPGLANSLSVSLMARGHYERAAQILESALSSHPDHTDALGNRSECLRRLNRLDEAESAARRLLSLTPGEAAAMNALAVVLRDRGAWDEAEALLRAALSCRPDFPQAHANMGALLMDQQRIPEAEAAYRRALSLDPTCDDVRCDLGMNLLQQRRFQEGWPLYESRLKGSRKGADAARLSDIPIWQPGQPIHGKSLIVYTEQGFGDTVQFMRLLSQLSSYGAKVSLRAPKALSRLLDYNLEPLGIKVIDISAVPPLADYQVPMQSLPLCLGQIDPYAWPRPPYLKAPEPRRFDHNMPKVGLAFSASSSQVNPAMMRCLPLPALRKLLSVPGIFFVSLQRGEAECMVKDLPIEKSVESARDFADTADIIAGLDLVLSVDTVAAHLAGALGRPLWLLANFALDWRWSMAGDGPCPWYPQRRTFRCLTPGAWDRMALDVATALAIWRDEYHSNAGSLASGS